MSDSPVELLIHSRERDLGGFHVRRILPYATHRMVGPFIFFDHMGPAHFPPGQGISVRPHPHIHLATVTFLFEGCIHHRDSLGSDQLIEPGAINWMTAGRGIVHSERTPAHLQQKEKPLHGIQLWVALPEEFEETAPTFTHHPKNTLPEFKEGPVEVKLLLGKALGRQSPVKVHSDLFYFEVKIPAGARFEFQAAGRDTAIYVVDGRVRVGGEDAGPATMVVLKSGADFSIEALEDGRVMYLGGSPIGPRHIYWNFVSSRKEAIEEAKRVWAEGPQAGSRFAPVPGDDAEFIPLPADAGVNPKGNPL